MVLFETDQPEPQLEEENTESDELLSAFVNFFQYIVCKFYGYQAVQALLPRPLISESNETSFRNYNDRAIVVRDSLKTVCYLPPPNVKPLCKATGVMLLNFGLWLVPYVAIFYGKLDFQLHYTS